MTSPTELAPELDIKFDQDFHNGESCDDYVKNIALVSIPQIDPNNNGIIVCQTDERASIKSGSNKIWWLLDFYGNHLPVLRTENGSYSLGDIPNIFCGKYDPQSLPDDVKYYLSDDHDPREGCRPIHMENYFGVFLNIFAAVNEEIFKQHGYRPRIYFPLGDFNDPCEVYSKESESCGVKLIKLEKLVMNLNQLIGKCPNLSNLRYTLILHHVPNRVSLHDIFRDDVNYDRFRHDINDKLKRIVTRRSLTINTQIFDISKQMANINWDEIRCDDVFYREIVYVTR